MTKVKFVQREIVVANATVAGIRPDTRIQLPPEYDKCTGICVIEVNNGGISRQYDLALEEQEGVETIALCNSAAFGVLATNTDIDPTKRFRSDVHFSIVDKPTKIRLETKANTTSELRLSVVFRVEKYENC